jgi:hypothetical protein
VITMAMVAERPNVIHAAISEHVNAKADDVRALYADPHNWAAVFSKTIKAANILRREAAATIVEVDHAEGRVSNILRHVSPTRIELRELKRRYDATFLNDFVSEDDGMRFTLTASVFLKWPYRLAEPLLKPLVLRQMRRYVVVPLKRAAEDGLCRLRERP